MIGNYIQINIEPKHLEELRSILKKNLPKGVKFYLYGSRAKGNHRKFSDVDIALEGKLSFESLALLNLDLEESNLPFRVDVHRIGDLDPDFLEMIRGDFVEI